MVEGAEDRDSLESLPSIYSRSSPLVPFSLRALAGNEKAGPASTAASDLWLAVVKGLGDPLLTLSRVLFFAIARVGPTPSDSC
jgi:hypothetical protein